MNICILADNYPSKFDNGGVFIAQLCDQIADRGHGVTYIAPQSLTHSFFRRKALKPKHFYHKTTTGSLVNVYQPYVLTFGNIFILKKLNSILLKYVVSKVLKRVDLIDVFYGHFWHNAYFLFQLTKKEKKPLFVATGESEILFHKKLSIDEKKEFKDYLRGVICVSSKNKNESIEKGLALEEQCVVFPNGIDETMFFEKKPIQCRNKLQILSSDFVVIFVGAFCERKGVLRLSDAIKRLNDVDIKVVFIGKGEQQPTCNGIIYQGFLPHTEIVDYLNSGDVFVLPTLAEGCCNAIVEAMACGLPVISSDLLFNKDILDENNSIMIDPNNVEEIASAIKRMKEDHCLKSRLAKGAKNTAKDLTLSFRAKKICDFIELQREIVL